MSAALEVFKTLGAAAGLVSAGFFIYDRVVRIRPLAFFTPGNFPEQIDVVLRNISSESIIIDEMSVKPNLIGLAKGDSVLDVMRAVVRRGEGEEKSTRKVFFVLEPLEETRFGLVVFEAFHKTPADQTISISFCWRTTRHQFPLKRMVTIKTSVADVAAMKKKDYEADEE